MTEPNSNGLNHFIPAEPLELDWTIHSKPNRTTKSEPEHRHWTDGTEPNSPDSPPPRPCPLLLCRMKNGLARSDTHRAPANRTSSGSIHISARFCSAGTRPDGFWVPMLFSGEESDDFTSLPGLTRQATPSSRCASTRHHNYASCRNLDFKVEIKD